MRLRRTASNPRIEMLPLIDLIFLLLIFFIYAMLIMAVHRGIPVSLPVSSTAEIERKITIALSISASGEVFLDQQPVAMEDLSSVLAAHKAGLDDPEGISIQIFADKSLAYQKLYAVLDSVRTAGISRVSLQAER